MLVSYKPENMQYPSADFSCEIKHFSKLSTLEFHDIIALRIAVFVLEQNCVYQDVDGKDTRCFHLIGRDDAGQIAATARIIPAGISYTEVSIGRVTVAYKHRNKQYGHDVMRNCMRFIEQEYGQVKVRISAQKHLVHFYHTHGFISTNKEYLEDGIPHVEMLFTP